MGMRVFELAKVLGLKSKDVIHKARELGMEISSHMNSMSEEQEAALRRALGSAPAEQVEAPALPVAEPPKSKPKAKPQIKAKPKVEEEVPPGTVRTKEKRIRRDLAPSRTPSAPTDSRTRPGVRRGLSR